MKDAAGQGNGAKVLGQMVAVGRTHRLRMSPSLVALVRALALLDGVLRGLDPARDLVADLRRELLASVGRKLRLSFGRFTGWLRALPARLLRLRATPTHIEPRI